MTLTFSAVLDGPHIHATLGSDEALKSPVWCFSLMAPGAVVSGGVMLRRLAGYCEVLLPDLVPGQPHQVVLAHANPGYVPRNRAWLPLGGYLRLADGTCHALPGLPQGVWPGQETPDRAWSGLRIVPQPEDWRPAGGVLAATAFACLAGPLAEPLVEPLAAVDALARRRGLAPLLAEDGVPLRLVDDPGLPPDGYRIEIGAGITLASADRGGAFYGAITLLTLRETHGGQLPKGVITDRPRYGWRGQHLDSARHFFAVAAIRDLLDLMALLKLNRFHWHLADDEAFRLQVATAPALWQKTAWRGEGLAVPGVFGGGIRAGGSYSAAEVAGLVAHAQALNIAIMPEIEVPAHSHAMVAVLPGLRDPSGNEQAVSVQGYGDNVVNPALPATWDLLEPLAEEVAGMFPFGLLHLGCDELPHGAWEGSPAVAALMAAEGLTSRDDVQAWTMQRLARHLTERGLRVAAWEEAAKGRGGGIGHEALLFSWTGQGPGVAAARAGYQVVMCPAQNAYLDMAHTSDPDDWGASWAGFIPLEQTVAWQVIPPGAEDIAPRIAGVQACYWGEFTTEDRQMQAMLAPRLLGIACKAWEGDGRTDGPALRALAAAYGPMFDRIGWQRRRDI
jgi:hexosaminidase